MDIHYRDLKNGIRIIQLSGTMDATGTGAIESRFAEYCSGEQVRIVADLQGVNFLASGGVRLLTRMAKSIAQGGGLMILVSPIPEVNRVLEVTGIPSIIPIYSSLESAEAVLAK